MEWYRRVRAVAHISLWAGLIASLLGVSLPKIFRGASKYSIHFVGPFHSSNIFLHFATGATDTSERLIALFDSLASAKPILIFERGDDPRSTLLGMMTAYLAWPHPVRIFDMARAGSGSDLNATDFVTAAAIVFCCVNRPQWLPPGEHFGEALEVVPMPQVAKR
jgi:hypothetical protein